MSINTDPTNITPAEASSTEALRTLQEFALLEENWDSYDALPITPEAIDVAGTMLRALRVVPLNDGGVQIEMGHVEIDIGPDGKVENILVGHENYLPKVIREAMLITEKSKRPEKVKAERKKLRMDTTNTVALDCEEMRLEQEHTDRVAAARGEAARMARGEAERMAVARMVVVEVARIARAEAERKREIVRAQVQQILKEEAVTCPCGTTITNHGLRSYRCFCCGVVFCFSCAEVHFSRTVDHERENDA